MAPGTAAANAHSPHVIVIPWFAASPTDNGLATIAVRNIALVITVPLYATRVRNALVRPLPIGSDSGAALASDWRIGKITPPARAVLLGIAGASTKSAATRL